MRPSPKKQRIAGGLRRTTLASYRLENWCPFWCPFGLPNRTNHSCTSKWKWWLGTELNRRHKDFQSSALPTELPSQLVEDIDDMHSLAISIFPLCASRKQNETALVQGWQVAFIPQSPEFAAIRHFGDILRAPQNRWQVSSRKFGNELNVFRQILTLSGLGRDANR